jgi:hypothetical protein
MRPHGATTQKIATVNICDDQLEFTACCRNVLGCVNRNLAAKLNVESFTTSPGVVPVYIHPCRTLNLTQQVGSCGDSERAQLGPRYMRTRSHSPLPITMNGNMPKIWFKHDRFQCKYCVCRIENIIWISFNCKVHTASKMNWKWSGRGLPWPVTVYTGFNHAESVGDVTYKATWKEYVRGLFRCCAYRIKNICGRNFTECYPVRNVHLHGNYRLQAVCLRTCNDHYRHSQKLTRYTRRHSVDENMSSYTLLTPRKLQDKTALGLTRNTHRLVSCLKVQQQKIVHDITPVERMEINYASEQVSLSFSVPRPLTSCPLGSFNPTPLSVSHQPRTPQTIIK